MELWKAIVYQGAVMRDRCRTQGNPTRPQQPIETRLKFRCLWNVNYGFHWHTANKPMILASRLFLRVYYFCFSFLVSVVISELELTIKLLLLPTNRLIYQQKFGYCSNKKREIIFCYVISIIIYYSWAGKRSKKHDCCSQILNMYRTRLKCHKGENENETETLKVP